MSSKVSVFIEVYVRGEVFNRAEL